MPDDAQALLNDYCEIRDIPPPTIKEAVQGDVTKVEMKLMVDSQTHVVTTEDTDPDTARSLAAEQLLLQLLPACEGRDQIRPQLAAMRESIVLLAKQQEMFAEKVDMRQKRRANPASRYGEWLNTPLTAHTEPRPVTYECTCCMQEKTTRFSVRHGEDILCSTCYDKISELRRQQQAQFIRGLMVNQKIADIQELCPVLKVEPHPPWRAEALELPCACAELTLVGSPKPLILFPEWGKLPTGAETRFSLPPPEDVQALGPISGIDFGVDGNPLIRFWSGPQFVDVHFLCISKEPGAKPEGEAYPLSMDAVGGPFFMATQHEYQRTVERNQRQTAQYSKAPHVDAVLEYHRTTGAVLHLEHLLAVEAPCVFKCGACQSRLHTFASVAAHMQAHRVYAPICLACKQRFPKFGGLVHHVLQKHPEQPLSGLHRDLQKSVFNFFLEVADSLPTGLIEAIEAEMLSVGLTREDAQTESGPVDDDASPAFKEAIQKLQELGIDSRALQLVQRSPEQAVISVVRVLTSRQSEIQNVSAYVVRSIREETKGSAPAAPASELRRAILELPKPQSQPQSLPQQLPQRRTDQFESRENRPVDGNRYGNPDQPRRNFENRQERNFEQRPRHFENTHQHQHQQHHQHQHNQNQQGQQQHQHQHIQRRGNQIEQNRPQQRQQGSPHQPHPPHQHHHQHQHQHQQQQAQHQHQHQHDQAKGDPRKMQRGNVKKGPGGKPQPSPELNPTRPSDSSAPSLTSLLSSMQPGSSPPGQSYFSQAPKQATGSGMKFNSLADLMTAAQKGYVISQSSIPTPAAPPPVQQPQPSNFSSSSLLFGDSLDFPPGSRLNPHANPFYPSWANSTGGGSSGPGRSEPLPTPGGIGGGGLFLGSAFGAFGEPADLVGRSKVWTVKEGEGFDVRRIAEVSRYEANANVVEAEALRGIDSHDAL
eukprot:TRINITY_DN3276_c0_g1_i3.p1 TRINITY_DN3276_c0_g1~~TRINITY_DN3276_c0_g1_i3.p1  ORF type:complete len:942 (+),score=140.80 TRINITY_DN3276_c0_g1_i3:26-2827(+)